MGRCREYVQNLYGFPCDTVERVVVTGALPVVALPNNPDRVGWVVFNLGANIAYLAFDSQVAALRGMQVAATGGIAGSSARDDGEMSSRELWCISPAGASTLYIAEIIGL